MLVRHRAPWVGMGFSARSPWTWIRFGLRLSLLTITLASVRFGNWQAQACRSTHSHPDRIPNCHSLTGEPDTSELHVLHRGRRAVPYQTLSLLNLISFARHPLAGETFTRQVCYHICAPRHLHSIGCCMYQSRRLRDQHVMTAASSRLNADRCFLPTKTPEHLHVRDIHSTWPYLIMTTVLLRHMHFLGAYCCRTTRYNNEDRRSALWNVSLARLTPSVPTTWFNLCPMFRV